MTARFSPLPGRIWRFKDSTTGGDVCVGFGGFQKQLPPYCRVQAGTAVRQLILLGEAGKSRVFATDGQV